MSHGVHDGIYGKHRETLGNVPLQVASSSKGGTFLVRKEPVIEGITKQFQGGHCIVHIQIIVWYEIIISYRGNDGGRPIAVCGQIRREHGTDCLQNLWVYCLWCLE